MIEAVVQRNLDELPPLGCGSHELLKDGACVMEAVAYVAGEPWSDWPECVCPVIGALLRRWNDDLPSDSERDRLLRPLVPRLVGSRADEDIEKARSWLAVDWLIREWLPAWLDLTPQLQTHGRAIRENVPKHTQHLSLIHISEPTRPY